MYDSLAKRVSSYILRFMIKLEVQQPIRDCHVIPLWDPHQSLITPTVVVDSPHQSGGKRPVTFQLPRRLVTVHLTRLQLLPQWPHQQYA
jgi:hypothetical protein